MSRGKPPGPHPNSIEGKLKKADTETQRKFLTNKIESEVAHREMEDWARNGFNSGQESTEPHEYYLDVLAE